MGWEDKARKASRELPCANCGAIFEGTFSQGKKFYYGASNVFCSPTCRSAKHQKVLSKERGPCPTCGETFRSKTSKIFCSLKCYTKSDRFKEVQSQATLKAATGKTPAQLRAQEAQKTGKMIPCLECGVDVYRKPSDKGKYCSKTCYRAYLAKRFDRWVANPKAINLVQCYDEFLNGNELECPVDGCGWVGHALSNHMNFAHGVTADEFKRASGFNLSTGVVSKPMRESLEARDRTGIAVLPPKNPKTNRKGLRGYVSREALEHKAKSRAMASSDTGPTRKCRGCGQEFQQSTIFGKAKYCSIECRTESYAKEKRAKAKIPHRDKYGRFVWKDRVEGCDSDKS